MFNKAYSETMGDGQEGTRSRENEAIKHIVQLMKSSDAVPTDLAKRTMAIHSTFQVWVYFLEDLASAENHNSESLKANLISIGIFVLNHLDKMRKDRALNFAPIMEISETIQGGLK